MGCGTLSPSERAASRQTQLSSLSFLPPSPPHPGSPPAWHGARICTPSRCRTAAAVADPLEPPAARPPLPICPPSCSATPGAHLPGGNLIGPVLPAAVQLGDRLGDRGGVGEWEQRWQGRERAGGAPCCVTLSSLLGLSGLRLLGASGSSGSRVKCRQRVAHLLMPGTAPGPHRCHLARSADRCVTPGQGQSVLITAKGLGPHHGERVGAGVPCRQPFPPLPGAGPFPQAWTLLHGHSVWLPGDCCLLSPPPPRRKPQDKG